MKSLLVLPLLIGSTLTGNTQTAATPQSSATTAAQAEKSGASITAVTATLLLQTDINSRSAHEGKEIKATLAKAITLPTGETLPKGAIVYGFVAKVSPHSKGKPNGVLLLTFDRAVTKGGDPIPLVMRLKTLAPVNDADPRRDAARRQARRYE